MKILASLDETMKENIKRKKGEKRKKELKGEMVWGDERRRRKKGKGKVRREEVLGGGGKERIRPY